LNLTLKLTYAGTSIQLASDLGLIKMTIRLARNKMPSTFFDTFTIIRPFVLACKWNFLYQI